MFRLACCALALQISVLPQVLAAPRQNGISRSDSLRGSLHVSSPAHKLASFKSAINASAGDDSDAFAWLEDVSGKRAMSWVRSENKRTLATLGDPTKLPVYTRVRDMLESKDRIAFVHKIGGFLYNLWQDQTHHRGLWRRTTLEEYKKDSPKWETVLDVDALGRAEGESWVWKHHGLLHEGPDALPELVLIHLSRGGADAVVVREFNLTSKKFLPAPQGFYLPEAKTDAAYLDRNTLLVGTDFGKGSMTASGYARTIRQWRRGTDLQKAPVFFEGSISDVSVHAHRVHDRQGCIYDMRGHATSFYTSENYIRIVTGPGASDAFSKLDLPTDAAASTFATQLVVQTRSVYSPTSKLSFPGGSLIAMPLVDFLKGERSQWTALFVPNENRSLNGYEATLDFVVLRVLDAVKAEIVTWRFGKDGKWELETSATHGAPLQIATMNVWPYDAQTSNMLWVQENSFLVPTTLSLADSAAKTEEAEKVKSLPQMFNITGLEVTQRWAISKDGTRVPYFLVSHAGAKGSQPTLLYGYGGFRIPQLPFYSSAVGALWLERGGAFALANIRGGGEFGPNWHQAAVKANKHKSFEDFAAIAEHLVSTGITSHSSLGIMGGSNGGFLVGNMLVKYPKLFGAVVCQVPLLDMKRYNKLLAGASWMAEYGNPDDPHEWAFLRKNSPYHIVDSHVQYPPALFITSTRDDRVHPSHARKMVAKMESFGAGMAKKTFLYENVEGGHGAAADAKQSAMVATLEYEFLWQKLHKA